MSRAVLFDTETTGLDPRTGDRIIEIAAIELHNDLPTGRTYHSLIDPERDVPEESTRVHGITRGDLQGKPKFAEVADELLGFFADSPLIAHNASFDFGFVNAELARLDLPKLDPARMVDTLVMAKQRFPGMPNSLDALCRRFGIDLSERTTHNALLDCRLLAEVYIELTGGRQRGLSIDVTTETTITSYAPLASRTPRPVPVPAEQQDAHGAFIATLKDPIWTRGG